MSKITVSSRTGSRAAAARPAALLPGVALVVLALAACDRDPLTPEPELAPAAVVLHDPTVQIVGQVTVTTEHDIVDGDISSIAALQASPGADGEISLREAVSAANNTAGADEILFHAALDGTPIVLDLPDTGEDANADGDLDLTDPDGLVITGNGESSTILDGAGDGRVIHVPFGSGDLTVTGLTVRNGDARTEFKAPGGGMRVNAGDLILERVTVLDNVSETTGGGLYYDVTERTATLLNCTFTGNMVTDGNGGGVRNASTDGMLVMDRCAITGNSAFEWGGGVYLSARGGTGEISNSVIADNTAGLSGGGVRFEGSFSSLTISRTQVSGNSAGTWGGGVSHSGSTGSALTMVNSTISGNRAATDGGGLVLSTSSVIPIVLNFVTFTDNTADSDQNGTGDGGGIGNHGSATTPTIQIGNSIVQGNDDATPGETATDDCSDNGGTVNYASQGGNVFGDGTGCPVTADDTTDPALLGPLQDNGGPSFTHALPLGSSAIDFAVGCVLFDQRGHIRDVGPCDSGAFEAPAMNPIAALGELIEYVESLGPDGDATLNSGQRKALVRKLEQTLRLIDREMSDEAVAVLQDFRQQALDLESDGVLSASQQAVLVNSVDVILAALGVA